MNCSPLAGMLMLDRLGVHCRPAADVLRPAWEEYARATGGQVPTLDGEPVEECCGEEEQGKGGAQ